MLSAPSSKNISHISPEKIESIIQKLKGIVESDAQTEQAVYPILKKLSYEELTYGMAEGEFKGISILWMLFAISKGQAGIFIMVWDKFKDKLTHQDFQVADSESCSALWIMVYSAYLLKNDVLQSVLLDMLARMPYIFSVQDLNVCPTDDSDNPTIREMILLDAFMLKKMFPLIEARNRFFEELNKKENHALERLEVLGHYANKAFASGYHCAFQFLHRTTMSLLSKQLLIVQIDPSLSIPRSAPFLTQYNAKPMSAPSSMHSLTESKKYECAS